ncbi:oxygen-insensitive NADPH nitroreductase [Cardiobacterium hominis]|uniref:oxygen-insensitive NADPH nitroreductase n=1 Tax=Cardiobacterium hominis TaxID=2718 RepID=UPI0028EDDAB3|nr:oxygen-insensitive NADPH nitroreductase [Cardiobacterium hominis]
MNSNPAVATALAHRSIRKFTQQPIAPEILESLIDAGRMASTSNNLQCVSIIRVTDAEIRAGIRRAASDMAYITDCAEFLLFCMDFYKAKSVLPEAQVDWAEVSMIGAIDTGIMAQNVLLAAESLGLGGVFIGALRNDIEAVAALVGLPEYCVPLVGLCLGYPERDPPLKPRLPRDLMFFENCYVAPDEDLIAQYDAELRDYYLARSGKALNWSHSIRKALNEPVRPHMLPFLQKQGLLKQ